MTPRRTGCRACGHRVLSRVLDLGAVPAGLPGEPGFPLAMHLCGDCGLAQLADDDTVTSEPRGVESRALREQARDAVARVTAAGWLTGATVREFGSPHGGSWLELLEQCDIAPAPGAADIVLDCFGLTHEPDQRAAFAERAAATLPGGVLLLQYHALASIVEHGQWNALQQGHFAYYSIPALVRLLADVGMRLVSAWDFALHGGTTLVAAVHEHEAHHADSVIQHMQSAERHLIDPATLSTLQSVADGHAVALRRYLEHQRLAGRRVFAYGATPQAVALFTRAGLDSGLVAAVADASPAKQGRRMPGTDIAIISPDALVSAAADEVVLMDPDLSQELATQLPELEGRWVTDDWIVTHAG
ncbi:MULTISPECIES: transferase [unclassified Mycobacterium]|uniref:transferase n=1 Tax=unclassified Mycobacterium TaxID=2642494 RepID=UPI0029C84FD2|nr:MULTISPECIES: transferase [unclassified Mycobacterium]